MLCFVDWFNYNIKHILLSRVVNVKKKFFDMRMTVIYGLIIAVFLVVPLLGNHAVTVISNDIHPRYTVIIDAGHGGIDGGAAAYYCATCDKDLMASDLKSYSKCRTCNTKLWHTKFTKNKHIVKAHINHNCAYPRNHWNKGLTRFTKGAGITLCYGTRNQTNKHNVHILAGIVKRCLGIPYRAFTL